MSQVTPCLGIKVLVDNTEIIEKILTSTAKYFVVGCPFEFNCLKCELKQCRTDVAVKGGFGPVSKAIKLLSRFS